MRSECSTIAPQASDFCKGTTLKGTGYRNRSTAAAAERFLRKKHKRAHEACIKPLKVVLASEEEDQSESSLGLASAFPSDMLASDVEDYR
eukprot:1582580-Amphidinium_carterae.1